MKRLCSIVLVVMLMFVVTGGAVADVISIDTETASVEEIESMIEKLQNVLLQKSGSGSEQHTFKNGYTVSVLRAEKKNKKVTIHYSFSHQNEEPTDFDMQDTVFQNGIELNSDYTYDDVISYGRNTLKNATVEVTRTYVLLDDSPLTIYLKPWFSKENSYVVTIELT